MYISGSQPPFVLEPFIFLEGLGATRLLFCIPLPSSLLSSLPPTAKESGERCKLLQQVRGWSPSRQRILEHSSEKSDHFWHVARDFSAFKATRNFSIFTKNYLVIFTITVIAANTLQAYPVKMRSFAVFAHIFFKFFRRSRATFWGLAGHFWPRATGWEPLMYIIDRTQKNSKLDYSFESFHCFSSWQESSNIFLNLHVTVMTWS